MKERYIHRGENERGVLELSSIVRAASLLEVRQGLRKKHSRAVDKLEYLSVDVLRGAECWDGSMVFSQVNTTDGYARVVRVRARQPGISSRKKKKNRRRRDEKGCFIYLSLLLSVERKNTSSHSEINSSNSDVRSKRKKKEKNKSTRSGYVAMMETAIEKFSLRKVQFSDVFTFLRFSDIAHPQEK